MNSLINRIISFFQPARLEGGADLEIVMKTVLVVLMSIVGITVCLAFGVNSYIRGRIFMSVFESLVALYLFTSLIYLRKRKNLVAVNFSGTTIIGFYFLYLLLFCGVQYSVWSFALPIVAIFLLGQKTGLIIVFCFLGIIFSFFIISPGQPFAPYPLSYAIRFSISLVVVSILTYIYETTKSGFQQFFINKSREQEETLLKLMESEESLRKSQERLRYTEKMEAISTLAGGVAHDFNNLLASIIGFAGIIQRRTQEPDVRDYADKITKSSKKAAELTSQLLAFARKGKYFSEVIDVHVIIRDVIAAVERQRHPLVGIRSEFTQERVMVSGDPNQLQSSLMNLAVNAVEAMPHGGDVVFTTSVAVMEQGDTRLMHDELAPGRYVQIDVRDTGRGIDKESMKHLFEPFYSTKHPSKGAGLGLASAYGIVRNHDGVIHVRSEVARGSVFTVLLPIVDE